MIDFSKENTFRSESSRHQKGTLNDMLTCHREKTKILNALDFPMLSAPHPPTSIASDLEVFHSTVDLPMCAHTVLFPVTSTRWGLAATSGAHHLWHIDCNGFCTYIDTQTGQKWWIVARPKNTRAQAFLLTNFVSMLPTLTSGISKQFFFFLDLNCKLSLCTLQRQVFR